MREGTPIEAPVVRKATSEDVEAVARIWHSGWADGHLGNVPPELVRHRSAASFLSRARARIEGTWLAESSGRALGFVMVKGDELEQIYVDKDARGSGVASLLLRKGEAEIRSAGHRRAWLAVVAGNQRARSFYSREGWLDCGAITYMAETEEGALAVPAHRYEVELSDPQR